MYGRLDHNPIFTDNGGVIVNGVYYDNYGGSGNGGVIIIDDVVYYPIDQNDINPVPVTNQTGAVACKCTGKTLFDANGNCYCEDLSGGVNTQVAVNPLGNISDIIKQHPLVAAGVAGLIVYAIFGK